MPQNVILYDAVTARYAKAPTPDEVKRLYDTLAYEIQGAEHSPQAQRFVWDPKQSKMVYNKRYTGWDGVKRLYNRKDHSFPIGLIHRALQITPDAILKPLVPAIERKPLEDFEYLLKYSPYRHQKAGFQELTSRGHAMVELPTASGKSLLITMLALSMRHEWGLITVPSRYLLHQTKEDIEDYTNGALQLGVYGDGECEIKPITIATVQSLYSGAQSRPEIKAWLDEVKWWTCDETHGAAADSYQEVSGCLSKAMVRYGVTATCRREDNAELVLEGVIGPLVYRETAETLIHEGILALPEVEIHNFEPAPQQYAAAKPQYKTVYKACISQNKERNDYVLDQINRAIQDGMDPVLVLVEEIEHGKLLEKLINDSGIRTEFLSGKDPSEARSNAVRKLVNGYYPVLVASGIFNTGVNIPCIQTLINAGAGMSVTETIQRAGRALRKDPKTGKIKARIIDFYDDEAMYLRRHAKMRRSTYLSTYPGMVTVFEEDLL